MGMFDSFFHPEQGYQEAQKPINQGWDEAQKYIKQYNAPFQQAGANEIPRFQNAVGQLLNPQQLQNQWVQGYQQSPWAQDMMQRSQATGLDAASAMGLSGSSPALENIQRTGSSIMHADRQNYLDDLIKKYQLGMQGSQNIFGTGAQVGQSMGQQLGQGAMEHGQNLSQLQFGEQNAPGELFSHMLGLGAGAVGTAFGGPIGGAIANKFIGSYQPWQSGVATHGS